jgi:hypothetical protein
MHTNVNKPMTIACLLLMVLVLSACEILETSPEPAGLQSESGATATTITPPSPTPVIETATATTTLIPPTAAAPIYYRHEQTGISFSHPAHWTLEATANSFVLRNGTIWLRIAYRRAGEQVALWTRTGLPAGDFVVLNDPVSFLGQTLARSGLVYEERLKMVFYGGEPASIVAAEAMEFTIMLEDRGTDYLVLDIPGELLAEAEAILASFAMDSNRTDPTTELLTYTNPEVGFTFQYPPSWSVTKVSDEAFAAPSSRSVHLSRGTVTLVIGYRHKDEAPPSIGTSVPAGDLETRGSIHMLGRDIPRQVLVFEGKDKVVFYGQPGVFINAGDLEFAARMDDFVQVDYRTIELSPVVQGEADLILSSLEVFGVARIAFNRPEGRNAFRPKTAFTPFVAAATSTRAGTRVT